MGVYRQLACNGCGRAARYASDALAHFGIGPVFGRLHGGPVRGGVLVQLDDIGFVYIPQSCTVNATACAVHVVFHGCKQGARVVGSGVYSSVGYNQWADSNQVIVLYPQVGASQLLPLNPEGCWDWWGYSGFNFQVKSGVQLAAVKAMVDRLTLAR